MRVITFRHLIHEARFPDVGKPTDDERPCIGVDRWQTSQMLSNLLQVSKTLTLLLQNCTKPISSAFSKATHRMILNYTE